MSAPHQYPAQWKPDDWCVPTKNGHAVIKHGHTNPHDHSQCGPVLFCCTRSARMFSEMFPDAPESMGDWQLISAQTMASWFNQATYFVFCDEDDADALRAVGMVGEGMRDVINRKQPLEDFAEQSERLSLAPEDDIIFKLLKE